MSEKKSVVSSEGRFIKFCSFLGLLLSAVLFVLSGLFSGQVNSILNLIAKFALLVAIAVPAYNFTRGLHKAWKIIYWIALVIYVLGCVFGVLNGFGIIGK